MKTSLLMMMVAAGVLGLSGAASAEIMTATFTGTVNFVFDPDGGLPAASEGDTLVATYVFNPANAIDTNILPTSGETSGLLWSVRHRIADHQWDSRRPPHLCHRRAHGETQVFDTGSVIDAVVSGGANHLDSNLTGTDFGWILTTPATGFSYTTSDADQTLIQLANDAGDLVEADISTVNITVSSSSPVPEPSTWAMMLIGFAGFGFFSYGRTRVAASPAV